MSRTNPLKSANAMLSKQRSSTIAKETCSMDNPQIKRAIISVTDKTGVAAFAKALEDEFGVEIVSTGGTAKALEEAGVTGGARRSSRQARQSRAHGGRSRARHRHD